MAGPWWSLRPDSPAHREARHAAIADALRRAREYAEALGARVTALLELADTGRGGPADDGPGGVRRAGGAEGAPPELELDPQPQTVQAAVRGAVHHQRAGPGLMPPAPGRSRLDELVARARALAEAGPRQLLGIAGAPGRGQVHPGRADRRRGRPDRPAGADGRLPPGPGRAGPAGPGRPQGRAGHLRRQRLRVAAAPAAPAGADVGLRAGVPPGPGGAGGRGDRGAARRSGWW